MDIEIIKNKSLILLKNMALNDDFRVFDLLLLNIINENEKNPINSQNKNNIIKDPPCSKKNIEKTK